MPLRFRSEFDALEEASDVGRRPDVGGFVFSDTPDTILRKISANYIRDAWNHLNEVLSHYQIVVDDLAWGLMHPGVTHVIGVDSSDPFRFIGWTSRLLRDFDSDARWSAIDRALGSHTLSLRCAVILRALRWCVRGEEISVGLRLFEALAIDEYTEWSPDVVFSVPRNKADPWVRVATAIRHGDQQALDLAMAAAEREYSAFGYRIDHRWSHVETGLRLSH